MDENTMPTIVELKLLRGALAWVPRVAGAFLESDLEEALARLGISIDRAREIIDIRTQHGKTEQAGWLYPPGLDPYPYEPNRLIRDAAGRRMVEKENATIEFMEAESGRMHAAA